MAESTKTAPPSAKPGPKVKDSSSFYNAAYGGTAAAATCKVTFWNLTGKMVTVRVNGQPHFVAANQPLSVSLRPRSRGTRKRRGHERQIPR